jgi:hypothetical protein
MYVKGFVDVSGGNVRLRGKNDTLIVEKGDASFNAGNVFIGNVLTCSGGVVVKNNLNMVGLINQSNITLSGGYIYKEIVSTDINNNIITLTNTVNALSNNLTTNTGNVQLGSGANVILGNTTNNTSVYGKLIALADSSLNGNLSLGKDLTVNGNLYVNQYQTKQTITTLTYSSLPTLAITEDLSMSGTLRLNGNASISGTTTIAGSVGIGTNNPQSTLDVSGGLKVSGNVVFNGNLPLVINSTIVDSYNPSATTGSSRGTYQVPGVAVVCATLANSTEQSFLFDLNCYNSTNGATGVYFGGIPTSGVGNGSAQFVIGRRTGGTSWNESLRINSSGNVGIGTTNPQATLDVNGGLKVSGTATIGGRISAESFGSFYGEALMTGNWVNLGILSGQKNRMCGFLNGHMVGGASTGAFVVYIHTAITYYSSFSILFNSTNAYMTGNINVDRTGGLSVIGTNGHTLQWSFLPTIWM